MRKKGLWVIVSVLLVVGLLLGLVACAEPAPTTPTAPTSPTTPAKPEVLKIAANFAQNWPLGIECVNVMKMEADKYNNSGGLDLGGQKYILEFVIDDNKMDLAIVKTAAQKEVFQDGCKFILSDPYSMPLFQLCEENKVIGVLSQYDEVMYTPQYNWIWNAGVGDSTFPSGIVWGAEMFPELKTMYGCYVDRIDGRIAGEQQLKFAKVAGLEVLETEYYDPKVTDQSVLGTKIAQMNPDILVPYGGGPTLDGQIMKAAYAAGWRGKIFPLGTGASSQLVGIIGPECASMVVAPGYPTEFDPATFPAAQEFKEAYKAKFGKWEDPSTVMASTWFVLKAALQRAGSTDPEKVKNALDHGQLIEAPLGNYQQFPRVDQGATRTNSMVWAKLPIKEIENGKPKIVGTTTIEQQLDIMKRVYGAW